MHIVDDPTGLSERARDLLARTGWRKPESAARLATDFLRVRDRTGRLIPAPMKLVIRREAFAARFGGLQYAVRRSVALPGMDREFQRLWDFDLGGWMRRDVRGWHFDFIGERVSSPVAYAVHTDGRVGVTHGGLFLEIATSVYHLIESHAVLDQVASWQPWHEYAAGSDRMALVDHLAAQLDGLTEVAEASGPCARWLLGENVAIHEVLSYSSDVPRTRQLAVWARGQDGIGQIRAALA
ncbi:hypothetical protein [Catellatospora bangladeshensis]|uniref:hypothetical protein n=1 Tax=Catellatospora bangladeshensis TaxID=310355 RepID=UPI0019436A08|nr:hypothetical protein [Catellatospora bangladeshensis]